jgi:sugar phosphate permease
MQQRWVRLLPIMMLTYVISFMDRTNIGFAIPTMSKELGFTPSVVGFAAGILFLGLGISLPLGGWAADRGHGKTMIAWLMILWGITELLQGYIHTATELVLVRFALGLFEGGIFPIMLLMVRNWFASSERARANGIWQLSYPVAAMVSGPVAGYILTGGSWRTLFIVEGIFPIVWSVVWLWGVAESPRTAKWLGEDDRRILLAKLSSETPLVEREMETDSMPLWQHMLRRPVMLFCVAVFFYDIGFLGFIIWLPSVLHQDASLSPATIGWLSAMPFAAAIFVILLVSYLSDRRRDLRFYAAIPILVCGITLGIAGLSYASNGLTMNMLLLTIAGSTLYAPQPVLWSIPAEIIPARVLGTAMGLMNILGIVGSFVGPYLVGYSSGVTHTFAASLIVMGICLVIASLGLWQIREVSARGMEHRRAASAVASA